MWELRVTALWPIMRMYPNLKHVMLEHVRNQTLVQLAVGNVHRSNDEQGGGATDGEHGGEHRQQQRSPEDMRGWCESSASISSALLKQPQAVVDVCMEELRMARVEDGTLQSLLDALLEFSITKANRGLGQVGMLHCWHSLQRCPPRFHFSL